MGKVVYMGSFLTCSKTGCGRWRWQRGFKALAETVRERMRQTRRRTKSGNFTFSLLRVGRGRSTAMSEDLGSFFLCLLCGEKGGQRYTDNGG